MRYIVRHGQTDWNLIHRTQGHTDIPLNATGRAQAQTLIPQLSDLKIDRIISSDLSRAVETAEIINTALQKPISIDNRLRELNYGDFEGRIFSDNKDKIWHTFNYEPEKFHAESLAHLFYRVKDFCDQLSDTENILIATHGGVIRMIRYYADNPNTFDLKNYLDNYLIYSMKNTALFQWDGTSQPIQI